MSRARALDETPTPQLEFRRALAMKMLKNDIREDGVTVGSPMRRAKHARGSDVYEHKLQTRPPFTGEWKTANNYWSKVQTMYSKSMCAHCQKKVKTYCKYNTNVPLCSECYATHVLAQGNTF